MFYRAHKLQSACRRSTFFLIINATVLLYLMTINFGLREPTYRETFKGLEHFGKNEYHCSEQYLNASCGLHKPIVQAFIQHVQRAGGSFLCKIGLDNLGKAKWGDAVNDYRCEIVDLKDNGKRIHKTNHLNNKELIHLLRMNGGNRKVLSSEWEPFRAERLELKKSGVVFLTSLREPISRLCSWMYYANKTRSGQTPLGFDENEFVQWSLTKEENPITRMFSNTANVNILETDFVNAKKNLAGFDVVLVLDYHLKESIDQFLIRDLNWLRVNTSHAVNHYDSPCENSKRMLNATNLLILEKRNRFDLLLYQFAKRLVSMRLQCKKPSCV